MENQNLIEIANPVGNTDENKAPNAEKKEVINEANKIYDVKEVIPSIYLATELSRTKL